MPTNVKVIRAREFVRARPDGHAYLDRAEQLLAEIAQAGEGLDDFAILVDTREVSGQLSATELWRLAETLLKFRSTFAKRTAVLCPIEKFDHTRFFTLCADNHGFNIRAFTGYEDAMEWLIAD